MLFSRSGVLARAVLLATALAWGGVATANEVLPRLGVHLLSFIASSIEHRTIDTASKALLQATVASIRANPALRQLEHCDAHPAIQGHVARLGAEVKSCEGKKRLSWLEWGLDQTGVTFLMTTESYKFARCIDVAWSKFRFEIAGLPVCLAPGADVAVLNEQCRGIGLNAGRSLVCDRVRVRGACEAFGSAVRKPVLEECSTRRNNPCAGSRAGVSACRERMSRYCTGDEGC